MKKLTEEHQENLLYDMKKLIDDIRASRIITGEEHPKHAEIWQEIDQKYKKLDYQYQEEFNNYVN